MKRTTKCLRCNRNAIFQSFIEEAGLVSASIGVLTRKPLAVRRIYSAICPGDGKVSVADFSGHHISSFDLSPEEMFEKKTYPCGFIAGEPWQAIAFASVEDWDSGA